MGKWTTTPYEKNYFRRNVSQVVASSVFQSQNYFQIKSALDETLLNQAGKEKCDTILSQAVLFCLGAVGHFLVIPYVVMRFVTVGE